MFASLRIHTVFKRAAKDQKAPRARSGQGAASVIPYMEADRDSRIAERDDERWSVLLPFDGDEDIGAGSGR